MTARRIAGVTAALLCLPAGQAWSQGDDGPWPWAQAAPWHAVLAWTDSAPAGNAEEALWAAHGALRVGRPRQAAAILSAVSSDSGVSTAHQLALRAAVHGGLAQHDSAAILYTRAARHARGLPRGLLAARAGAAYERAGRGRAAAGEYLRAATDLPVIRGWLRLRAARALGPPDGFGLLDDAPPAASGLASGIRADLLLAAGDSARAVDVLATVGRHARAGEVARARGDSALARQLTYLGLDTDDTTDLRTALDLVRASFPARTVREHLLAGRAALALDGVRAALPYGARARAAPDADPAVFVETGSWLERAGLRTDALQAYERGGVEGAYRRARLFVRMRQRATARRELRAFVEEYPDDNRAPAALWLVADAGGGDSLREQITRRWPRSMFASRARLELAETALNRHDSTAARTWLEAEVAADGPSDRYASYRLGTLLRASSRAAEADSVFTTLARRDSLGYYGMLARASAGAPEPIFAAPAPRPLSREARARLEELDLLDAAGFGREADLLVDHLTASAWPDAEALLDLAEGLTARGRAPVGISLGWRAARELTLGHPRVVRVIFPWPYRDLIEREARKFDLDPFLLAGLIRQESSFKASARSRAGALGWMQLMPATGRWVAGRLGVPWSDDMFTVADANLHVGSAHLAALLRTFDGDTLAAVAAYNAGGTAVRRWLRRGPADRGAFVEAIPYTETRGYVKTVLRNRWLYRALYGTAPVP